MSSLYFTIGSKFIDQYEGKFPISNIKKTSGLTEKEKALALNNMGWIAVFPLQTVEDLKCCYLL